MKNFLWGNKNKTEITDINIPTNEELYDINLITFPSKNEYLYNFSVLFNVGFKRNDEIHIEGFQLYKKINKRVINKQLIRNKSSWRIYITVLICWLWISRWTSIICCIARPKEKKKKKIMLLLLLAHDDKRGSFRVGGGEKKYWGE